jgi:hypothetical protein
MLNLLLQNPLLPSPPLRNLPRQDLLLQNLTR